MAVAGTFLATEVTWVYSAESGSITKQQTCSFRWGQIHLAQTFYPNPQHGSVYHLNLYLAGIQFLFIYPDPAHYCLQTPIRHLHTFTWRNKSLVSSAYCFHAIYQQRCLIQCEYELLPSTSLANLKSMEPIHQDLTQHLLIFMGTKWIQKKIVCC